MSEVSGFVEPNTNVAGGFNFNAFLNSVGGSLNTWAVNALDRQINKDNDGRALTRPPESEPVGAQFFKRWGIIIVAAIIVGVAAYFFSKKKGK